MSLNSMSLWESLRRAESRLAFPTFSSFNHNCVANAVHSWNGKLGEESLYAVKTIRDKEEIIVNYS